MTPDASTSADSDYVTLNKGTACSGCSPIQTKSTPIPIEEKPSIASFKQQAIRLVLCVCIAALTVVNHALFGENHKKAVNFKYSYPRRDYHRHLTSAVKVTVDVVLVKHCGGHFGCQLFFALELHYDCTLLYSLGGIILKADVYQSKYQINLRNRFKLQSLTK